MRHINFFSGVHPLTNFRRLVPCSPYTVKMFTRLAAVLAQFTTAPRGNSRAARPKRHTNFTGFLAMPYVFFVRWLVAKSLLFSDLFWTRVWCIPEFGAGFKSALFHDFLLLSAVLRVRGRIQNPRRTPVRTKLRLKRFPMFFSVPESAQEFIDWGVRSSRASKGGEHPRVVLALAWASRILYMSRMAVRGSQRCCVATERFQPKPRKFKGRRFAP